MDPDKTLEEILSSVEEILDGDGDDSDEAMDLASGVRSLHEWLLSGGCLPEKWANPGQS